MNKAVKTFALSAMSVALLSGCILDDKYDDGSTGGDSGGTTIGNIVKLYGDNSDTRFQLQIVDRDGNISDVQASGDAESLNIRTSPVGEWQAQGEGSVLVSVTENQSATIRTASGVPLDLTVPFTKGTLQFFIRPLAKTQDGQKVFVSLPRKSGQEAVVDITSAFNSYVGSKQPQQVKIDLACFDVESSSSMIPFALVSESNVNFELGNTRLRANTDHEAHIVPCTNDAIVINEPVAEIFQRNRPDADSDWDFGNGFPANPHVSAWANKGADPTRTMPGGFGPNGGGVGANFNNDAGTEPGVNGGLRINVNQGDIYDFSQYMEAGILSFDIDVISEAQNHPGTIDLRFETPTGISSSMTYRIEDLSVGTGEFTRIDVPVKEFFTRADGRVDVEVLQNVLRLVIQPTPVKEGEFLNGLNFRINNMQMEMYPAI